MTLYLQEPLTYDQHRNDLKQQYQNISLESLTNGPSRVADVCRGCGLEVANFPARYIQHATRDPRPPSICQTVLLI